MTTNIISVGVGSYIGNSTCSEIEYAKSHGKTIEYLEPIKCEF
jgi:hypothetical protein